MTFSDWISWLANKYQNFKEYIPYQWFYDYEILDPLDKKILADQLKQKLLRKELNRLKIQREIIIRANHYDDLSRAQQKLKICDNWHSTEVDHLEQQRDRAIAILEVKQVYAKIYNVQMYLKMYTIFQRMLKVVVQIK
jgi:hypothetical protein